MIFAYITHTPCIALDSLSHKIKGCHEWIKDAGYIGLAGNVPEALSMADGIAIYVDLIIVIRYGLFIALLVTMIYVVNVQKKKS